MSDWSKKTILAEPSRIQFCRLCGGEIYQLRYANNDPYYTDVLQEGGRAPYVIVGSGNNYNFKPHHDCVGRAQNALRLGEATYQEFATRLASAKATVTQMIEADKELLVKLEAKGDHEMLAVFKRLRDAAEATLAQLEAERPGQEQAIQDLRTRVEKLAKGESIVPADRPLVGRKAKVIKGRKVPVGTTGTIFWMGADKFKENGVRVGIDANGTKHYTSVENIEVIAA